MTLGLPDDCVVDASVGIKLVIAEPDSYQAKALFDHLAATMGARFYVPDFFFLECTNILWKLVKKQALTHSQAKVDLGTLKALNLLRIPVVDLTDDALSLAIIHDLSAYDAAYFAASIKVGFPLITADNKLVQKLAAMPVPPKLFSGLPMTPAAP